MQEKGGKEVLFFSLSLSYLLICSQPTPGYFTDDQTLDFLLQIQDGVGMKKVNPWDSKVNPWIGSFHFLNIRSRTKVFIFTIDLAFWFIFTVKYVDIYILHTVP